MDKKRLEYFKNKLLEERKKTEDSLKNIIKRTEDSADQEDSELSSYGNHPADSGTELYLEEQDLGFEQQLEGVLEEIDQSLEDIENGDYGYCNNCEKMISEERLEILPYAKTCLGCSDEEREEEMKSDNSLRYKRDNSKKTMGYDVEDGYRDEFKDNVVADDPSYSTGDNLGIKDEREDYEITEEIEDLTFNEDEDDLR